MRKQREHLSTFQTHALHSPLKFAWMLTQHTSGLGTCKAVKWPSTPHSSHRKFRTSYNGAITWIYIVVSGPIWSPRRMALWQDQNIIPCINEPTGRKLELRKLEPKLITTPTGEKTAAWFSTAASIGGKRPLPKHYHCINVGGENKKIHER
jgi:hypothetical protein